MRIVQQYSVRTLIAATAMSIGTSAAIASIFAAEPSGSTKAAENAAKAPVNGTTDSKVSVDQAAKGSIGTTPAPAGDDIRGTLALVTEAAVTKGGFNGVVKHFVDADRERLEDYKSSDSFAKLDGRIDAFLKDWKSKYGQEFSFSKNASYVLDSQFGSISQGEIGKMHTASGKEVASNEPAVEAGTADALKKSGVSNTDANSDKFAGGDTNKDVGRDIATLLIPANAGLPELAVPLIHELPNSWQIDLPDNIDGQKLHDRLLNHLTMVDENRANWPGDVNEGYRIVTRHVLSAIMESETAR